jgi:hypothetical protein
LERIERLAFRDCVKLEKAIFTNQRAWKMVTIEEKDDSFFDSEEIKDTQAMAYFLVEYAEFYWVHWEEE